MTTTIPGRRTRTRRTIPSTVAAGYLRVSTADQADSGLGLDAQRASITAYAERTGLTIAGWFTDAGVSGSTAPDRRPGMGAALDTLTEHGAGVLLAAKLDRVSRSVKDTAELLDRAEREGWRLLTADGQVGGDDSPMGRAMVGMMSVFAQTERELIGVRTREALAELKAQGRQLGRPTTLPDAVLARIIGELAEGRSLRSIARGLESDGIRTASGREHWHPQQVSTAADSQRGQALAAVMFAEVADSDDSDDSDDSAEQITEGVGA